MGASETLERRSDRILCHHRNRRCSAASITGYKFGTWRLSNIKEILSDVKESLSKSKDKIKELEEEIVPLKAMARDIRRPSQKGCSLDEIPPGITPGGDRSDESG